MKPPIFEKSILGIAQAYGPYKFWLENLFPGANPDAAWRALLVVSALRDKAFIVQASGLLKSQDSRVRAWACFYLGIIQHQPASDRLFALTNDPSPRVRYHARKALALLQPGSEPGLIGSKQVIHPCFQVLISEDNARNRIQLATQLERRGFFTHTAGSETETLAVAQKVKPGVIVTDNQKITRRPGGIGDQMIQDNLSGLNMTWDICRNPELRETIIIMLTADEIEPIFIWSGGDYFLNKFRFGGAMLAEAVEQYMR